MTNVVKFEPRNNFQAEAELLDEVKSVVYRYSGVLSVAQVLGVLQIAKEEIYGEQL
jgi:hypothetical protein